MERVAVRALLSMLRSPPQPPQLLLLSRLISSPAPCGGVQPRHKHWLLVPANHVMVSRRHEESSKARARAPSFHASGAPGLRANGKPRHATFERAQRRDKQRPWPANTRAIQWVSSVPHPSYALS